MKGNFGKDVIKEKIKIPNMFNLRIHIVLLNIDFHHNLSKTVIAID